MKARRTKHLVKEVKGAPPAVLSSSGPFGLPPGSSLGSLSIHHASSFSEYGDRIDYHSLAINSNEWEGFGGRLDEAWKRLF